MTVSSSSTRTSPRVTEEPGERGPVRLLAVQKGAGARQEEESRRAEVGDPPGDEDRGIGPARGHAGVDPDVIDRHEDHHRAADDVEGDNTGRGRC